MKAKIILLAFGAIVNSNIMAQNTPVSQMEKLDRGIVALKAASGSGNFISWRLLGTDDEDRTTFDVMRGESVIARNLYATNYKDNSGTSTSTYRIVTKIDGEPVDTSKATSAWGDVYKALKLDRPATGANGGTYEPNDMSVGDVDADGEYELFVKWYPSNAKDNSQGGITDNTIIDCYKLDGTKLWRIDLGRNIRSGAHYTQYMVYDFDGDGKAEVMCKTGPGSLDSKGNYVNSVATDASIKSVSGTALYRSSDGRITGGQEWLTVFNGATGEAIHTIFYNPNRNMTYGGAADGSVNWGVGGKNDTGSYGNRGERYLAAVAHLGGPDKNPSGIFCRGYYDYAFIWAVDFDGTHLKQKWFSSHKSKTSYTVTTYDANGGSTSKTYSGCKSTFTPASGEKAGGSGTMYGNGNHNMSIADVDGDGCDEIIWGSAGLNNDGTLLYGTGFGHGDAIHLADHCPDRPGLEVFQIHEEKGTYAWDLHDAATGEILLKGGPDGVDNGRGIAGQFDANVRGSLFWSSSDGSARSAVTGIAESTNHGSSNFRVYWDGDLQEELFDGGKIDKWNGNGTSRIYLNGKNLYDYNASSTCNGSKSTPNLQADILGDWREEIILWSSSDYTTINIFTSNTETVYRMPTLMHDHTYRMGIAWQNTAYNQPPHLGYYLPDAMMPHFANKDYREIRVNVGDSVKFESFLRYTKGCLFTAGILPDGTKKSYNVPEGFERPVYNSTQRKLTLKGAPKEAGTYGFVLKLTGLNGPVIEDTIRVVATHSTGIEDIENVKPDTNAPTTIYDASGRMMPQQHVSNLPKGLYIIREGNRTRKILVSK